ncbi:MAG: 4Fe-4S binding protein [Clostridia bacterium]
MPYTITKNCIGCTACAKICPVEAIDGEPKQQYAINQKRCVSCGVCGRICPKGAVLDGHENPCESVPRSKWKKPVIDITICSACSMCVAICRAEALQISLPTYPGDYHVHALLAEAKKCVGCGLCARECPLHAIEMREVEA